MPRGKAGFVKKSVLEKLEKISKSQTERHAVNRLAKASKSAEQPCLVRAGRRIVHIATFATNMWCDHCGDSLSLRFLEKEQQKGLASVLSVRCHRCLDVVQVTTDTAVKSMTPGPNLYSVNCKAAFACVDTGLAHDQLNKFLSAINVPPVQRNTLKRAEECIAPTLVGTAKASCQAAIEEERNLTLTAARGQAVPSPLSDPDDEAEIDDPTSTPKTRHKPKRICLSSSPAEHNPDALAVFNNNDEEVPITIKYDFGWNKRGNGHAYDSLSGHGSAIGNLSNKVIAYDAMSKYCAMCARGHPAEDHDCAINYEGSSKGMEPHTAVKILLKNDQFKKCKVRLGTLIGDADSSTTAALARESSHPIQKWLDLNHGMKAFSRALWKLKLKGGFSWLTAEAITNLSSRCLGYALAQNRGNVEGTRQAIMNIVEHVYDNHGGCGDWCKAKEYPNYNFKDFPQKKALSCPHFKDALTEELQKLADNAEQLAPGGSTQQNESFNQMVSTRAPKSRFYGGTQANYLRVSATVSYKNLGAEHSETVFKSANLSPSVNSYRKKVQERRLWKANYQSTISVKRRRLWLKKKNHWSEAGAAQKEGPSYVSGMSTVMERAVAGAECANDWLPPHCDMRPECAVVYVDTETTGLLPSSQIVQIAAKCNDKTFSVFMMPTVSFSTEASEKTGFSVSKGALLYRGKAVCTTPPALAAEQFINFLAESCGPQVLLVGHNILRFDAPRIVKLLKSLNCLEDFCEIVYGFTDTMPLIKQGKVQKQDKLAAAYLRGPEWEPHIQGAHNAISDVIVLEGLVNYFEVGNARLKTCSQSLRAFFENAAMNKRKKAMLPQLSELVGKVSAGMLGRMAAHGVTIPALVREYTKNGALGLAVFLGVRINGKPMVTNSKKIIGVIADHIKMVIEHQSRRIIQQSKVQHN